MHDEEYPVLTQFNGKLDYSKIGQLRPDKWGRSACLRVKICLMLKFRNLWSSVGARLKLPLVAYRHLVDFFNHNRARKVIMRGRPQAR